ncbi:MAG: hypothetical protein ABJH52_02500 [Henriciella sp.]
MKSFRSAKFKSAASVFVIVFAAGLVAACGGGGGGGTTVSPPPPPPPASPTPSSVTISGAVTFDKVPHNSNFRGLDYDAITQEPARGVVVQAVNVGGTVLDSDVTDTSGAYDVTVNSNTDVQIRVRSELQQSTGATWDIQVLDNTSSNAIYVLSGSLTSSGAANSTRNLNAPSGWDLASNGYTSTRAAAPFSILDAIYETVSDIAAVDSDVTLPPLQVLWSVGNVPTSGDVANGEIGTSSYTVTNDVPTIRILGDADNDTDEYDIHVIVHEFGHYFEDQLSRSDSPGGSHSLSNRLDARLAFGEGWGNAFSGIILDDPVYRDSGGAQQSSGFAFSVEQDLTEISGTSRDAGWFNEATVQQILYDIYDSANDGQDTISGGLAPIYNAFTDNAYIDNGDFTTIFSFADRIRNEAAVNGSVLDAMLLAEDVNGSGSRGIGETNIGGLARTLPVYKVATQGGSGITVCSDPANGDTNKHGVREFITLSLASTGALTMTASETSGPAGTTDPDFRIWETGRLFTRDTRGQDRRAESSVDGTETWMGTLDAGTYAIEFYDFNNLDAATAAESCFSFTVT